MEKYIKYVEERININRVDKITDMNSILVQARNEALTKRYKRKVASDDEKKEQLWVNEEFRRKIKERKENNRRKRNERNEDKQKELETKYIQKKEVQKLVKESITAYEKMITEEIKRDKNKLWVNIDKLRNKCGMNIRLSSYIMKKDYC